jgi:hypothetical protein
VCLNFVFERGCFQIETVKCPSNHTKSIVKRTVWCCPAFNIFCQNYNGKQKMCDALDAEHKCRWNEKDNSCFEDPCKGFHKDKIQCTTDDLNKTRCTWKDDDCIATYLVTPKLSRCDEDENQKNERKCKKHWECDWNEENGCKRRIRLNTYLSKKNFQRG